MKLLNILFRRRYNERNETARAGILPKKEVPQTRDHKVK